MGVANEAKRNFAAAEQITVQAGAAITGKRFLRASATKNSDGLIVAQHAASGTTGNVIGVSAYDIANGARGVCIRIGEVTVTAGEALVAGDVVGSSAAGKAVKLGTIGAGAIRLGVVTADAANDADAYVLLTI